MSIKNALQLFSRKINVTNIRNLKVKRTQTDIIVQNIEEKGIIILNRPSAQNAVNPVMIERMHEILKQWEREREKILIMVKGNGGGAFCCGGSLIQAAKHRTNSFQKILEQQYDLFYLINNLTIPYIAIIDGMVNGTGIGLSLPGQYRVATEKTIFEFPHGQKGFLPDMGSSYFLPRLSGRLGLYLALTGQRLIGKDVYKAGIATHFCKMTNLGKLETELLQCEHQNEISYVLNKYNVNEGNFSLESNMEQINKCFGVSTVEEILNQLKEDGSEWAAQTEQRLKNLSPVSLKLTMKALKMGSRMDLEECLTMESKLLTRNLDNEKFLEAVGIIEKKSKKKPVALADVSDDFIDSLFWEIPKPLPEYYDN